MRSPDLCPYLTLISSLKSLSLNSHILRCTGKLELLLLILRGHNLAHNPLQAYLCGLLKVATGSPLPGSTGREVCSGNHTNIRPRRPRGQVLGSPCPAGYVTLSQAVNFLRLSSYIHETQTTWLCSATSYWCMYYYCIITIWYPRVTM